MKKTIAGIVLLVAYVMTATAQNAFTLDAPAVVSVGEIFRIVYTATYEDDRVSDFVAPRLDGFDVMAGPVSSTSMSFQSINGKSTTVRTQSYTYTVTVDKEGKVTVPEATIKIGKETFNSGAKVIEVLKEAPASDGGNTSAPAAASVGNDIFMRLTVNKTDVVVGEPLVVTLKLYVQSSAISGFEDIRFPSFDGFWSQELDAPQNIQFERENYNGSIYNAALLRRYMLLPQQTGKLGIDPAEMVCVLQVRDNQSSGPRSIFDDFFDTYRTVRKRVVSDRLDINVSPLPSGAPASFTGGVGSFRLAAGFDSDSVSAHEATSLKVVLSGTGNINLIDAPKIQFPSDFETYDVRKTDNISAGASGSTGTVTFEYPFIPRVSGDFDIQPVEITYYDVASGAYRTLSSGPLHLKVGAGNATDATVIPSGVNKQSVKSLGSDIRFIATSPAGLRPAGRLMVDTPLIYVIPLLIIVATAVIWILLGRNIARRSDIVGTRNRKALKVAKARLKNASSFLRQNLYSAFYEELHKAIEGYVSDKLMLPVSDLSRERIEEELKARGRSEEVVRELFELLDACEYARYAPSSGTDAMDGHYRQAVKVISEIESQVR